MKKILLLALLASTSILAFTQEVNWMSFEEATKLNETAPRKIIIDVYTDWCGWCKVMDKQTFQDSTIAKILNEKYYAVKLNAEQTEPITFQGHTFVNEQSGNRSVHQLAAALLNGKMSYPSIVFMNEQNQGITAVPGFQKPEQMEPLLIYISNSLYEKNIDYQEFVTNYGTSK